MPEFGEFRPSVGTSLAGRREVLLVMKIGYDTRGAGDRQGFLWPGSVRAAVKACAGGAWYFPSGARRLHPVGAGFYGSAGTREGHNKVYD